MIGNHFGVNGLPEPSQWANNTYDEAAIFDRILTAAEIRELAAAAGPPSA